MQNAICHSLSEINKAMTLTEWQHMLLQRLYILFGTNGAFPNVPATYAMCTNKPPYHHKCWLLNFVLITDWMVALFIPKEAASMISKENFKILICQNTGHCFTWPQSTLRPKEDSSVSGSCLYMVSFLHGRHFNLHLWMH